MSCACEQGKCKHCLNLEERLEDLNHENGALRELLVSLVDFSEEVQEFLDYGEQDDDDEDDDEVSDEDNDKEAARLIKEQEENDDVQVVEAPF